MGFVALSPWNRNLKLFIGRKIDTFESVVQLDFGFRPILDRLLLDVSRETRYSFDKSDCFQLPVFLQKLIQLV